MPKQKDIETIYNELQELLANADDDLKLRVYDELLQTGSVTLTNDSNDAHIFVISELIHIEPSENETLTNDIYLGFMCEDREEEIDIDYDLLDLEVLEVSEDAED